MTLLTSDEQFSSATLGVYSTSSFFTRFSSLADLFPVDEDSCPSAIPTHVHEFVHYLHNISTTAGIRAAFLANAAVFTAAQFLIEEKKGVGKSSDESTQGDNIGFFIKNLNFILGSFEKNVSDKNEISKLFWNISHLQSYTQNYFPKSFAYQVTISGRLGCRTVDGILKIGLNFITEGVAYEVERELWEKRGDLKKVIDDRTPIFPYLTYEPLVDYLVGRPTTPLERISVGNAALMHYSPSQGFVDACLALRKSGEKFEEYLRGLMGNFESYVEGEFEGEINILREFYAHTDKLEVPFENYLSRIKDAAKQRMKNPCLEALFLRKNLTSQTFLEISCSLAENVIVQEKADGTAVVDYRGNRNGLANSSNEDIIWFIVLCSAIHFVKQHFTSSGRIVATKFLKETKCPFSGACHVELAEGNPEMCKKSPWKFEPKNKENKEGVCWYIAGIRSITPNGDSGESKFL
ncbi:hypothetical protein SAMN05216303_11149 [Rhodoferax sp. OV413]|uniref:hypothetical protein n=1 Tax=Rhodoferax sp. OV413 TaxID=1855285 RepID=UPI00088E43A7|nr:hypothetical protein [Rhodoferax sp. OV413]SDP93008.1 hypothetical protein SAMN05216303_11149 [Rhodoferax sp. OV413]